MKDVKIADLKARLSEHLRSVRRGEVLTVFDRSTPVARVVPYSQPADALAVRAPSARAGKLADVPLPRPLRLGIDVVELLMEERQVQR